MATYKVIQDVEAEDKFIGPLTLRQFIYAGVATIFVYLSYFFATHSAAFMMIIFIPIALISGFFAFPWGRDQPTEVWALAKVRFMLKPRRRTWDQSGVKELVTITAPKKIAASYTNNLSEEEVRSRLKALAVTIDTRGWAIKNSGITIGQMGSAQDSDRLLGPSLLPKPMDDSVADVPDSADMLDEQNNANARRLDSMMNQSAKAHHEQLIESLKNGAPEPAAPPPPQPKPANYWFLNQPGPPAAIPDDMVTFNTQLVAPGVAPGTPANAQPVDEANIVAQLDEHKKQADEVYRGHMHTIQPLSAQQAQQAQTQAQPPVPAAPMAQPAAASPAEPPPTATSTQQQPDANNATAPQQTANTPVTQQNRTAILQLANNNDLDVATIAREAERATPKDEVVIKLH